MNDYEAEERFKDAISALVQQEALRLSLRAASDGLVLIHAFDVSDGSEEGDAADLVVAAQFAAVIEKRLDPKLAATVALFLVKHYLHVGLLHWEEGIDAEFDGIGNRYDGAALVRPAEGKEQAP